MPRKPSTDPLVPLPLRVPASFRLALEAEAQASGETLSDTLRRRLASTEAPPLGKRVPRRRKPSELGPVSTTDPNLLRQLAAIGSNLNQLARAANTGAIAGTRLEATEVLARLLVVERLLDAIRVAMRGASNAH